MNEVEFIRKKSKEGMRINREGECVYLTFPAIERTGAVRHLMSTRLGGVSEGDLWSMNLSYSRGDQKENVDENFRRIGAVLGYGPEDFVCSDQTHTTNIRRVTAADKGKGVVRPRDYHDVDGLITDEPGIVLSTFYADCVPLLFVDPVRGAAGLSHSGWRGTVGKMGAATVKAMEEAFGCRPEDIWVGIGPSICQDCYEVSEDVAEAFREVFCREEIPAAPEDILYGKGNGKFQLDLWKANAAICLSAGIRPEKLCVTDVCTCCNPSLLFSHRASGGKRGNLGMFVVLNQRE